MPVTCPSKTVFVEDDFVEFPFRAVRLFDRGSQRAFFDHRQAADAGSRIGFVGDAVDRELFGPGGGRHDKRAGEHDQSRGKDPVSTPPNHFVDHHAATLAAAD